MSALEEEILERFRQLDPVQYHLDDALLKRAYELATQYNRPTAYVWPSLNACLIPDLSWVKWLGNFKTL
jgi:hypothetical protein